MIDMKRLITVLLLVLGVGRIQAQDYQVLETIAHISDYGCEKQSTKDVSNMVRSWNPEIILSSGDDNYARSSGCADNIDANVGQFYADYIYPYPTHYKKAKADNSGYDELSTQRTNHSGLNYNRFYPVPGNHDFESGIESWLGFFQHDLRNSQIVQHPKVSPVITANYDHPLNPGDPGNLAYANNKRFYGFRYDIGDGQYIEFFGLNIWQKGKRSGCQSTGTAIQCDDKYYDPIGTDSYQYQWLEGALENSTAEFKIVFLHKSPYSSPGTSDHAEDRAIADALKEWKFHELGVDAVIAGDDHYFETNWRNDMPFFINGLGGHSKTASALADRVTGNLFHDGSSYGALKLEVIRWNDTGLKDVKFSYYGVGNNPLNGGELIKEFFLRPRETSKLTVDHLSQQFLLNGVGSHDNKDNYIYQDELVFWNLGGYVKWLKGPGVSSEELGMDPSGDGYTLRIEFGAWDFVPNDTEPRYLYWLKDQEGKVMFALKHIAGSLYMDRYTDIAYPRKTWQTNLWTPNNVLPERVHTLYMSVKEDKIRVMVYHNQILRTKELTYLGGQELTDATEFGFGSPGENRRGVQSINAFAVYDKALDYGKMHDFHEHNGTPLASATAPPPEALGSLALVDEPEIPISIYPNPSQGVFSVDLFQKEAADVSLALIDLRGNILYSEKTRGVKGQYNRELDLSSLSDGVYVLQVDTPTERYSKKIIIKK